MGAYTVEANISLMHVGPFHCNSFLLRKACASYNAQANNLRLPVADCMHGAIVQQCRQIIIDDFASFWNSSVPCSYKCSQASSPITQADKICQPVFKKCQQQDFVCLQKANFWFFSLSLTMACRHDLVGSNVRVTSISPGAVRTEFSNVSAP